MFLHDPMVSGRCEEALGICAGVVWDRVQQMVVVWAWNQTCHPELQLCPDSVSCPSSMTNDLDVHTQAVLSLPQFGAHYLSSWPSSSTQRKERARVPLRAIMSLRKSKSWTELLHLQRIAWWIKYPFIWCPCLETKNFLQYIIKIK